MTYLINKNIIVLYLCIKLYESYKLYPSTFLIRFCYNIKNITEILKDLKIFKIEVLRRMFTKIKIYYLIKIMK